MGGDPGTCFFAREPAHQVEPGIDAGRHAAGSDDVSLVHHTVVHDGFAVGFQLSVRIRMRSRAPAFERRCEAGRPTAGR